MLYCAAAPEREANYPDTTPRVEPHLINKRDCPAQWGTGSHTRLEKAVDTPDPKYNCYDVPNTEGYPADEHGEMQRVAQVAYDYVYDPTIPGGPRDVRAEERVYPGKLIGVEKDLDGTADIQILTDSTLEIVDLKTGRRWTPPDDPQLKYYAAGAMVPYMDVLGNVPFDIIRTTVIHDPEIHSPHIQSRDWKPEELIAWMETEVDPKYGASLDPNAKATPSIEGCQWCRVADCKERAEWILAGATQINQEVTVNEPRVPDITTLSDEQIMTIHDYMPLLQSFGKIVDQFITTTKKQDPSRFPLLKFTPRLGNSKWTEPEDKMGIKLKNQKFKKADYTVTKIKSPSQMLKIADAKQKEYLNKNIVRPEIGFKLVPVTNAEDGVNPNEMGIKFNKDFPQLPKLDTWDQDASDPSLTEPPAADPFACLN